MEAFRSEIGDRVPPATVCELCDSFGRCADARTRASRMVAFLCDLDYYAQACLADGWASRAGEMSDEEFRRDCPADRARRTAYLRDPDVMAVEEKGNVEGLTCSKCGKRNIRWTQEQTRSADEPAVSKYKCLNAGCGHQWV